MRFRIVLFILFLAAPPLLAAAPLVHAGTVEIDVDPAAASFLPVDSGAVAESLCAGVPPVHDRGTITPRGECDISPSPPPRLGFFTGDGKPADGSLLVPFQAASSDAWQGSAPVATPCGQWDVSMVLDSGREQPVSQLTLAPSAVDPAQGVFAGEAQIAVRYRFVNRDLGTSLETPAVLSLELSGHWAADPDGNLKLFAGAIGGEGSAFPSCGIWGGTHCPVCLTSPPQSKRGSRH